MLTNVKNAHIEALNHAQTLSGKTKTRNLRVISESCASTKCSNPNVWRSLFVGHAEFSSIHLRAAAINYLSASWNRMREIFSSKLWLFAKKI